MQYHVRIVQRLSDIDEASWQRITARKAFGGLRWLRFAASILTEFRPLISLLYADEQLVGAGIWVFSHDAGVSISSALGRRIMQGLLKRYPLLLCQTPIANTNGLILPTGDEIAALRALDDAIRTAEPAKQTSFTVYGWLTPDDEKQLRSVSQYGIVSLDAGMILNMKWAKFEDFHKSLSRTMRRNVKRHDKAATELGIKLERTHHFSQFTPRLLDLSHNVWQHHANEATFPYRDDLFAIVERDIPESSVMILAKIGEKIVGFGLLLWDEGVMTWAMLGIDYSYRYVYFQIIYEAIRCAIDLGIKVIRGGTGAYEYKRRLGFEEVPNAVAFGSAQPILRWLGTQISRTLSSDNVSDDDSNSTQESSAETMVEAAI